MTQESNLKFPCSFDLKVFGKGDSDMESILIPILNKYVKDLSENCISAKPSRTGKYIAITAHFEATSKEQLDKIYGEITKHPDVLMAL